MTSDTGPKVPHSKWQERLGIRAVDDYCLEHRQIWRELRDVDVGIDGHIEYCSREVATGKVIAVQVKSGPSYFKTELPEGWLFKPEPKHEVYWERYPLPVILILHDGPANRSYWVDIRQTLRNPHLAKGPVLVPRAQVLQQTTVAELFRNAGVVDSPFIDDLDQVVDKMILAKSPNGSFPLAYLDLLAGGLTNICRSLYFGADLACDLAEIRLAMQSSEHGAGFEHDYLFGYVEFLVSQNLAHVDFADCLIEWIDRQMLPHFVAPLTPRGRALINVIDRREKSHMESGALPDGEGRKVAQEGFFGMVEPSYLPRVPRILLFSELEAVRLGTASHTEGKSEGE